MKHLYAFGIAVLLVGAAVPTVTASHADDCRDTTPALAPDGVDERVDVYGPGSGCVGAVVAGEDVACDEKASLGLGPVHTHALDRGGCTTGLAVECWWTVDCSRSSPG